MQLQVELYVLSFLLKGQVDSSDLLTMVMMRMVEVEKVRWVREHQSICTGGDERSHATMERILLEQHRDRSRMEMSMYSQAIEHWEQHLMCELL